MNHPFKIYDLRFTIWKKSAKSAAANRQSSTRLGEASGAAWVVNRKSQQGVALIVTLILLSVVTFMAVTYLAISRRERGAVTTTAETATARLAADAALAGAEAQVVANIYATGNPYNFDLLVSTNYINGYGFDPGVVNPTNVNYNYTSAGNPLTADQMQTNIANLFYSPRAPVFVANRLTGTNELRFYLDLNRNGRFDTNGYLPMIGPSGRYLHPGGIESDSTDNVVTNFMVGDPEWIGVLERPDTPHGPNNRFVARFAFIAVPIGNALDLNAIHNQAWSKDLSSINDGFMRNQGVGSWEINLAAFLADLNTNKWLPVLPPDNTYYGYYRPGNPNRGHAFEDARALLAYRYANNYATLLPANSLFANGSLVFPYDNIDGYSDGPLQITLNTNEFFLQDDPTLHWAGADNTNHFFTHQELFDPAKTQIGVISPNLGFTDHLLAAGTNVSTYDRYTFYRLLSQLGTDSAPEADKININYSNAVVYTDNYGVATNIAIVPGAETNFVPWTPVQFFTVAADRLLRAYTTHWRNSNPTNFAAEFYSVTNFTGTIASQWTTNYLAFGITNIPVWVSNRFVYSSAVNRLLQLAANICDATTTNSYYPSVFRPIFEHDNFGNVFIVGYSNLSSITFGPNTVFGTGDPQLATPYEITQLPGLSASFTPIMVNVYGVPWIIGAKKGFPNFNKFTMQNVVQISRKLQIKRNKIPIQSVLTDFDYTNQLYAFTISNSIGIECWNSYRNRYSNDVQIVALDTISMQINNDAGALDTHFYNYPLVTNLTVHLWPGSAWTNKFDSSPAGNSFITLITNTVVLLTNSDFYFGTTPPGVSGFYPDGLNLGWETNKHDFQFPHFGLLTTNRLQVFMLDGPLGGPYHVIDYVHFNGPDDSRDLNAEIQNNGTSADFANMWSTALNLGGVPWGIISQIDVSHQHISDSSYWQENNISKAEIDGFSDFMGFASVYGTSTSDSHYLQYHTNFVVQVPYTPTVTASKYISWQANDPLVHYLASDLPFYGTENSGPATGLSVYIKPTALTRPYYNIVNDRYQPWGRSLSADPCNLAYKDPLVRISDNWDFPTSKLPAAGWLGRVHRGTPWQTVYLKASNILTQTNALGNYIGTNTWITWTGNGNTFDAVNAVPAQDWLLFDVFSAAFNDNATRGTLSVNVGALNANANLAAWSALFSGVVALSNNAPESLGLLLVPQYQNPPPSNTNAIIQPAGPAGANSPLGQLVTGINQTRARFLNRDGLRGAFEHVGDILSVPQLTERSPFLRTITNGVVDALQLTNGVSDEMYEWLPQQVMSLLRVSSAPRYVVYCYGQGLKPAPNSFVTGGPLFGMCTNYQVVSEIATRAVVRFGGMLTNNVVLDVNTNWVGQLVVTNNNAVIEQFNVLPPD